MTTRADARAEATARLRSAGDDTAALDADLLLAHVCGVAKEALYAHLDAPLASAERSAYRELVERRATGEPVAYLRGYKEFFGLRFAVDPRVLIPRPETEVLVEAVLAFMRGLPGGGYRGGAVAPREADRIRVADVGTGSGAIAVAIAVNAPRARVIGVDSSAGALDVARANVAANGVQDRVGLREGDLLDPVEGAIDVLAANLPYLRADALEHLTADRTPLLFEPRDAVLAGGSDGLDVIRRAVAQLPEKLAPGGAVFFECDPPQAGEVERLLRDTIRATTRVLPDLSGAPRVVEGIEQR